MFFHSCICGSIAESNQLKHFWVSIFVFKHMILVFSVGEVILDPATAQRDLCLSEDGRQVHYEEHRKSSTHSDTPRRFSPALFVLAREGLSTGRHYWEVDMGHKTAWTVGVARGRHDAKERSVSVQRAASGVYG